MQYQSHNMFIKHIPYNTKHIQFNENTSFKLKTTLSITTINPNLSYIFSKIKLKEKYQTRPTLVNWVDLGHMKLVGQNSIFKPRRIEL